MNKYNSDIEVINKKIEVLKEEVNSKNEKNKSLLLKKDSINSKILKNKRDIDSLKYKINYLEENINNNLSIPKQIKAILDNPKFNGVHNVISSLINTSSEYNTAISTALSSMSSYLVVDSPNVAKELINYLKVNNLGRATFYPLSVIKGRGIDNNILSVVEGEDGYISIASNLVDYDPKYKDIIENVLGNTIIVKDIDSANRISTLINKRYKIVSLDGQVVNVGGSLTGGSKDKYISPLSIKYDLDLATRDYRRLEEDNVRFINEITTIDKEITNLTSEIYSLHNDKVSYEAKKENIYMMINKEKLSKEDKESELRDLTNITNNNSEEDRLINSLGDVRDRINAINKDVSILKVEEDKLNNDINELEETSKSNNSYINKKEKELNSLNIMVNRMDVKLDNLLNDLNKDYNMTYEFAISNYRLDIDMDSADKEIMRLKNELLSIGEVNLSAPSEYERVKERYDFLKGQKDDLITAENTLYDIIKEMDSIMKNKLSTTFEEVRREFKIVYKELFKGGNAEIYLTDKDNILETGIEIKAEPPGKKLQSLSLLSGGEKTFTAISLLFAILNVRGVPFCLFDEVEAALDDANVEAFGKYLDKYRNNTQFIIITHKKKTMEYADVLYGITMQESGVSKIVSVKLEDIKKNN